MALTSTTRHAPRCPSAGVLTSDLQSDQGFTLVELLVVTIIVLITMGLAATTMTSTQRAYGAQRERMETTHQAQAGIEMIARLVRMSGNNPFSIPMAALDTDPDGNGAYDSIRIRADWNPADGDIADPYEDITFTVENLTGDGNQLFKEEPADGAPVLFADNVASLLFTYRDTNNNPIADPVTNANAIAFVTVTVTTRSTQLVQDGPPIALTTAATVRRTE